MRTSDTGEHETIGALDATKVRALYEGHAGELFAYFARRVGRDLAEDLLADTFREVISSSAAFDERRGSAQAWLFGIGSNLLRRHWRTEQRRLRALARSAGQRATSIDPLLAVGDHVADQKMLGHVPNVSSRHSASYTQTIARCSSSPAGST